MRKNLANDTHDKEKKRKKIKWNFSSSSWVFCDCCARLRPSRLLCASTRRRTSSSPRERRAGRRPVCDPEIKFLSNIPAVCHRLPRSTTPLHISHRTTLKRLPDFFFCPTFSSR
jgi:hypothetical protein